MFSHDHKILRFRKEMSRLELEDRTVSHSLTQLTHLTHHDAEVK